MRVAMCGYESGYESGYECGYESGYESGYDSGYLRAGSRKNKLIPLLVDEDTVVPRVLRCLAMLNFHRDRRLGFLWPRLMHAITH